MTIWDAVLQIKSILSQREADYSFISVRIDHEVEIGFDEILENATFTLKFSHSGLKNSNDLFSSLFKIEPLESQSLSCQDLSLLELYLPYAVMPYFSEKFKKCYSISHFAQTLDGRIASFSGESKWIGNEENLIHAHRMRALCDAILIGANTLDTDDPQLNVRLVNGSDPVKIIIGGNNLSVNTYKAVDESTIMFRQNHADIDHTAETIILEKNPLFDAKRILKILYEKGIHSVYIEGGAFTTSNFLKQGAIDQVQLHISPKILGSGTSSFSFDGIVDMEQAIEFSDFRYVPIGKDMMFIGNLT